MYFIRAIAMFPFMKIKKIVFKNKIRAGQGDRRPFDSFKQLFIYFFLSLTLIYISNCLSVYLSVQAITYSELCKTFWEHSVCLALFFFYLIPTSPTVVQFKWRTKKLYVTISNDCYVQSMVQSIHLAGKWL